MANPTPKPAVGNDFPDRPEENMDDEQQDQPDPDEFAALVGTDNITDEDGGAATGDGEQPERPHGSDVRAPIDAGSERAENRSDGDTDRGVPDTGSTGTGSTATAASGAESGESGESDDSATPSFDWRVTRDRASSGLSRLLSSASNGLRGLSERLDRRR